eukprot:989867-Rhodomonas_salina.4
MRVARKKRIKLLGGGWPKAVYTHVPAPAAAPKAETRPGSWAADRGRRASKPATLCRAVRAQTNATRCLSTPHLRSLSFGFAQRMHSLRFVGWWYLCGARTTLASRGAWPQKGPASPMPRRQSDVVGEEMLAEVRG